MKFWRGAFSFSQKIISRCGCFFHPDRPPVIFHVEVGKIVEKTHVETTSLEAN